MRSLCLSHCLSPLLIAIQPGLAGSQILSGFVLCALDCTRLCRSCNRFAVPLSSPYPLVYFRNRCNLHSNHARGAGRLPAEGARRGQGKGLAPFSPPPVSLPDSLLLPHRAWPIGAPAFSASSGRDTVRKKSPCVTRPCSQDRVFWRGRSSPACGPRRRY